MARGEGKSSLASQLRELSASLNASGVTITVLGVDAKLCKRVQQSLAKLGADFPLYATKQTDGLMFVPTESGLTRMRTIDMHEGWSWFSIMRQDNIYRRPNGKILPHETEVKPMPVKVSWAYSLDSPLA